MSNAEPNDRNESALVPVPGPEPPPAPVPHTGGPIGRTSPGVPLAPAFPGMPDAFALLRALRRRWLRALGLGLLAAGAAAAIAWTAAPAAEYTVQAMLHVSSVPPKWIFDTTTNASRVDFGTYQRTQATLLKSKLVLNAALRDPEVAALPIVRRQPDPLIWLNEKLVARFEGEILRISMSGKSPDGLKGLVNAVKDAYLKEIVDSENKDRAERRDRLQDILDKFQKRLQAKRKQLEAMVDQGGSSDADAAQLNHEFALERREMAQRELLSLEHELRRARAELGIIQGDTLTPAVASLRAHDPGGDARVRQDLQVKELLDQIRQLDSRIAAVQRVSRSPGDPALRPLRVERDRLRRTLDARVAELRLQGPEQFRGSAGPGDMEPSRVAVLQERIQVLEELKRLANADVASFAGEAQKVDRGSLNLEALRADISYLSRIVDRIGTTLESLKVELDAPPRVREIEEADEPRIQGDKRPMMAGMAGAGAFGLVLLGIAFVEFRSYRISSVDEVVRGIRIQLIGTLPAPPERRLRAGRGPADEPDVRWRHLLLESVDALRTLLLRAGTVEAVRAVMVTSAVGGEGKTSLACHLATSLARAGRRTLLIDCDLRNPAIHRLFDLPASVGISEVLRGETALDDAIQPAPTSGLWILPAGQSDGEATQALARPEARTLFDRARERYDFTIIDAAPVLPVADALLIGQHVDGAIYVILREVSRIPAVVAAQERLGSVGIRILGAVVAGVPIESSYASGYYDYSTPAATRARGRPETTGHAAPSR